MDNTKGSSIGLINIQDEKHVKSTLLAHHIKKRKINETWLIHPTHVTNMTFDFVYQRHMECFNEKCNKLFDHLEDLRQACFCGFLAQLLLLSESSINRKCVIKDFQPKELLSVFRDPIVQNILSLLEERNFFQKIQTVVDNFILGIRYYLVFGMIPVKVATPHRHFIAGPNFTDNIDMFLDTILHNMAQYEIPTDFNNILLTFTEGVVTCTNFFGEVYSLLTYGKERQFMPMNILDIRTPYLNMMEREISTLFYVQLNQSKTNQNSLQTNVIVSSELNERIRKILFSNQSNEKGDDGDNKKAMILQKAQSELSTEIDNLDHVNKGLKTASVNSISRKEFLDQIGEIDDTFELTSFLDKTMRYNIKHMRGEMDANDFNQLVDSCSFAHAHSSDLHSTVGPADAALQNKTRIKLRQEDELKRRVQMLIQENTQYKKYTPILRDQLFKVIKSQTEEALRNKLLEKKEKLLCKEITNLEKQLESKKRDLGDYEKLIKELQTLLKSSFDLIKGETKCHSILMHSLLEKAEVNVLNQIAPSQEDIFRSAKYTVIDFLNKIFPFSNCNEEIAKLKQETKPTSDDLTSVFDTLGVKAIPFFPNIPSVQTLKQNNLLLQDPVKRDVFVETTTEEVEPAPPLDDVHFIDINQKNPQDKQVIKEVLRKNNVLIYPGEEIFTKRFLNVQFPKLITDNKNHNGLNSLLVPLKSAWEQVEKYVFRIHNRGYTVTGQRIAPKIGLHTINFFIIPFVQQYLGFKYDIAHRMPSLILNETENMDITPILTPLQVISSFITSCISHKFTSYQKLN